MSISVSTEPRAVTVDVTEDELIVRLEDGRVVHVPIEWFPRLRDATAEQRARYEIFGRGTGIHWPLVDEDLSIRGLLRPDAGPLPSPHR